MVAGHQPVAHRSLPRSRRTGRDPVGARRGVGDAVTALPIGEHIRRRTRALGSPGRPIGIRRGRLRTRGSPEPAQHDGGADDGVDHQPCPGSGPHQFVRSATHQATAAGDPHRARDPHGELRPPGDDGRVTGGDAADQRTSAGRPSRTSHRRSRRPCRPGSGSRRGSSGRRRPRWRRCSTGVAGDRHADEPGERALQRVEHDDERAPSACPTTRIALRPTGVAAPAACGCRPDRGSTSRVTTVGRRERADHVADTPADTTSATSDTARRIRPRRRGLLGSGRPTRRRRRGDGPCRRRSTASSSAGARRPPRSGARPTACAAR